MLENFGLCLYVFIDSLLCLSLFGRQIVFCNNERKYHILRGFGVFDLYVTYVIFFENLISSVMPCMYEIGWFCRFGFNGAHSHDLGC